MGKYGYGYGYGYGSWGGSKKGSVSEWEKSHFGGYNRVLTDYPFIKIDFDIEIKTDQSIRQDLGQWLGDKLIKLYVLKANELGYIQHLNVERVERESLLFGKRLYDVISLGHKRVFEKICEMYSEMSPMFEHYKEGILKSTLEMEVKENNGKGKDGEGQDGEGQDGQGQDGEGQDGEGQDGQGEDGEDGCKGAKSSPGSKIKKALMNISESKPYTYNSSVSEFSQPVKFVSFAQRVKEDSMDPYRFEPSEIKDSEALIKLLDISFDPKSDEVKNLKLGKLDTSKLAEVPAGNISVYKQTLEDQDTKPFSVCVLADISGSMGNGDRIASQFHIMNMLYLALSQILPPDKLYIYGHSGHNQPEIYTFYSPYDRDYEKNIRYYQKIDWCQNYDGPVIEELHKKIRETNDDRIIFISLSDGEPSGNNYGGQKDNEELKRILEKARRDSFVTVGIGIEADHVSNLYTYAKPVWDLRQLPKEVAGIINQVVRSEFK